MKKIVALCLLGSYLFAVTFDVSGTVVSDNRKMLTSRYMGFVKQVNVAEGDRVKKGDLLYEIDSKEIDSAKTQVELAIQQAQLSLQMYMNQYTNALLNLQRNKRLYAKDIVSKFQLENLQLAVKNLKDMIKVAKKQVEQAKARLDEVMNQYNYLKVRAPNDGVIVQKNINVGEMAMPGMPAMVLTDLSKLRIQTEISEKNLHFIQLGKKVHVEIPSANISGEGTISAIIPSSNPMTHTFRIKISFDSKGKVVYPGLYSKISIEE
ncbi:MAG: efflux transporter periplasmic adaptor subunit [Campylobacteraceae bacterium 4484_4]|nr:MAG: efflux transporter periplasmic adaptor subunit [Campylobacteraceae bacterium 4484_4]